MRNGRNRRRNYLVDRRYQGSYVLAVIGVCALGMLATLAAFNYFSYGELESAQWSMHIKVQSIGEMIRPSLVYSMVFGLLMTALLLFFLSRLVMKRTVPPLYRLRRYLDTMGRGNLSVDLDWLPGEAFSSTADALNGMSGYLRKRFASVGEKAEAASGHAEAMLREGASREECRSLLETLEALEAHLRK